MGGEAPSEAAVTDGGVPKPRNTKFAFACAMLASMTSILLGYGEKYEIHCAEDHARYTDQHVRLTDRQLTA